MKFFSKFRIAFYFLLLIPIFVLVYEIRSTLRDTREMHRELYLLNLQRASNQRTILGLETRILHYAEEHEGNRTIGCTLCFRNLLMEKFDHKLIHKFLEQNGINSEEYMDGQVPFIEEAPPVP